MTKLMTGKDYPWLCARCRKAVDDAAMIIREKIADDRYNHEEGPSDMAYDAGWLCGPGGCEGETEKEAERV